MNNILVGLVLILIVAAFSLGYIAPNSSLSQEIPNPIEKPVQSNDVDSPYDWIKEDQIEVYNDRVIINLDNPEWAKFTDTNSMDPLIDETSHGIEIIPSSSKDIHVGDIISYISPYAPGTLIHRVIEVSNDGEWFCIVKGDNNPYPDPGKVRFDQIKRVLVAVIY